MHWMRHYTTEDPAQNTNRKQLNFDIFIIENVGSKHAACSRNHTTKETRDDHLLWWRSHVVMATRTPETKQRMVHKMSVEVHKCIWSQGIKRHNGSSATSVTNDTFRTCASTEHSKKKNGSFHSQTQQKTMLHNGHKLENNTCLGGNESGQTHFFLHSITRVRRDVTNKYWIRVTRGSETRIVNYHISIGTRITDV